MSGPLLYNPTRAGLEELEAMLVGRKAQVDKLVADLVADARRTTTRHWQLVGPRGSGKSHLTQLVALRLEREGWAVARLSEEQYRVNSLGDLLEQVVIRLEDDDAALAEVDADDLEDRASDRIRAWRTRHGKPVLVVVENLGLLFERKLRDRRDQAKLRELLGREPPFVLLATATSFVEATTDHDAPFYDFFQTVVLDDLTVDEVTELILARARWDHEEGLLAQSDRLRGRVRAMYHFSGGNPRLVMALYGVLRAGVTDELYQELLELLDAVTPYYQARLHDVAPQAERVLAEMALAGKQLTPAVIAKRCRMPTNQITALVSKLEAERFIAPTGRPDGRSRYYDLTDRLFRIWMQMREDRTARQRLRFLAEFFQRWYAGRPDEVDDAMRKTSTLLWTDVHEAATQRIRERLRTLDYLSDAVPERGDLRTLHWLGVGDSPPTNEVQALIDAFAPLLSDADPFVRTVAMLLLHPIRTRHPGFFVDRFELDVAGVSLELAAVSILAMSGVSPSWLRRVVTQASSSLDVEWFLKAWAAGVCAALLAPGADGETGPGYEDNSAVARYWLREHCPAWLRREPQWREKVVYFYEWMRRNGALGSDVQPYAAALAVREDPDVMKELSPEVREAVELLLGAAAEGGAVAPATAPAAEAVEPPRRPYRVEARGTASVAAEGKKSRGGARAGARGRGKLRG